jgi:hypothetical protein
MLPRPAWCWGVSLLWGSEWVFSLPCSPRPPCPIKVRGMHLNPLCRGACGLLRDTCGNVRGAGPRGLACDVCVCACVCLCAWWAADPVLETKPQLLLKSRAGSASPSRRGGLELRPDFWIETISDLPGPRIYVVSCTHARARARTRWTQLAGCFSRGD